VRTLLSCQGEKQARGETGRQPARDDRQPDRGCHSLSVGIHYPGTGSASATGDAKQLITKGTGNWRERTEVFLGPMQSQ